MKRQEDKKKPDSGESGFSYNREDYQTASIEAFGR